MHDMSVHIIKTKYADIEFVSTIDKIRQIKSFADSHEVITDSAILNRIKLLKVKARVEPLSLVGRWRTRGLAMGIKRSGLWVKKSEMSLAFVLLTYFSGLITAQRLEQILRHSPTDEFIEEVIKKILDIKEG